MMTQADFDSVSFLRGLTHKPGVYHMLDGEGKVLYIGKARDMKKRVASYFTRADRSPKTRAMAAQIKDIEITVTGSEKEALILESNQIKKLQPRYNIWFRDSKSYPYIYFSTTQNFPRLSYHRGARNMPGQYFGPYPNAGAVRETLSLMKKLFMIRQCRDSFFSNRSRPCLEYQISRCSAPCTRMISKEDYQRDVNHAVMFLNGQGRQVIDALIAPMEAAAAKLEYERAAHYRDQISNLRKLHGSQRITADKGNVDVVVTQVMQGLACVLVFFIRNGLTQGSQTYFPKNPLVNSEFSVLLDNTVEQRVMEAFLAQFYLSDNLISGVPAEILVNHTPLNSKSLEESISAHVQQPIKIKSRVRGERAKWREMAIENVELALTQRLHNQHSQQQRMDDLNCLLKLDIPVQRIECFDISHTSGEATVASCVVFDNGAPLNVDYRRFNVTNIAPGDDYAAMEQAILRRYKKVSTGNGKLPDMILIDGGRGQFSIARKVLQQLDISGPVLMAIAKGRSRKPGLETLFLDGECEQIRLPHDAPALHLIQHIRDEAHRFAISGHRQRRKRARNRSPLEDINGVGHKRRQSLLSYFGGLQGIMSAGIEDIAKVNGISRVLAAKIYYLLHEHP